MMAVMVGHGTVGLQYQSSVISQQRGISALKNRKTSLPKELEVKRVFLPSPPPRYH